MFGLPYLVVIITLLCVLATPLEVELFVCVLKPACNAAVSTLDVLFTFSLYNMWCQN